MCCLHVAWDPLKLWQKEKQKKNVLKTEKIPLPLIPAIQIIYISSTMQGLLPSSITMTICWAFLVIEALLLVEINVGLLRKKKRTVLEEEDDQLEVISLRTMAQETLGEWGGTLATVTYVFLGYTSLVAYSSKSGEIIYRLINLPESFSGFFFTVLFTVLISVGGTRATDRVNQWLTLSMIGMYQILLCALG